jgi:phosphate transport system protein
MPREQFERQLAQLQRDVDALGRQVEDAITQAVRALVERDDAVTSTVMAGDDAIDALRYRIEQSCVELLAMQQPMAGDLRWITAALIIANELERVGDYAAGMAKLALRINAEPLLKPLIDIPRMAEIGKVQLRRGMRAYAEHDAEAARRLIATDVEMDLLYGQILRELLSYMIEDPRAITRATYLLWVAHNLERIGDRATNIAERVLFAVTGRFEEERHMEEIGARAVAT